MIEQNKPSVIVIGGGEHHNALGVVRALGQRGYSVELITIGSLTKHYVSSSRYVCSHYSLRDVKGLAAYLLYRHDDINKEREIIISCSDEVTEHLNLHLQRLESRYYLPGISKQGRMPEIMDKTIMVHMAASCGIDAPKVWKLPEERCKVEYPCITKSFISSHGKKADIAVCDNSSQLDSFLLHNHDKVFVQPYISKKEEVQFIGCSLRGGEVVIIPGMSKILRSQPNTNTGFLEYGSIDPFYDEVVNKAKKLMHDFGYSGLFSFEVMRGYNDSIYFLEVNFRNDGNAWCVTKAGVNLPVIWVKACRGEDYTDELNVPKHILMMPEFQDFKLVLQRKISLAEWIKDWRRTDYFMEYDRHDKWPFFQYIIDKIR